MFVRTVVQLAGTDKEGRWQDGDKWLRAVRLVTKADGAGFSLADVRVSAGWEIDCHYKHHVEASLIVSGSATLTEYATGKSWEVGAGTCTWSGLKTSTTYRQRPRCTPSPSSTLRLSATKSRTRTAPTPRAVRASTGLGR